MTSTQNGKSVLGCDGLGDLLPTADEVIDACDSNCVGHLANWVGVSLKTINQGCALGAQLLDVGRFHCVKISQRHGCFTDRAYRGGERA